MKGERLIVRITEEEKEDFERAAEIVGSNVSDWSRRILRTAAISDLARVEEKPKFLKVKKE